MTSLSFTKIFFFFLITLLSSISNVYSSPPYEFVNQVCSKQDNPNLCLEVLKSDSRSEFAQNITIVTQIAVDFAVKNATKTRDYFRGVTAGPPGVMKSLSDCMDAYNNTITSLKICMSEDDCSLTSYDIHSAGDEVKRCQDIVDSNGAHGSFITSINTIIENVCWLCESLASLMCKD
ncbi:unnamed protein product [Lactuca virosa]|uniref:Pectinesterase inhibitor domain-containing protein n=1 Tax=Lactuca virosa TaxID=75947 RepID=A0AAU9MD84_9ASTR|nr:unnamed protein product [Lactuca virosa]